jgi:cytochrome c-type biogenesis protein CcmH
MRGSLLAVVVLLAALACDRNVEPYDPNEVVTKPDLSRIFPEGAERSGDADTLRDAMPEPAVPVAGPPGDGEPLRGTIRLAEPLAGRVPAGAVLFLIARAGDAGPPTAVRRIEDPEFPLEFTIGPDDRMIGTLPFTGPFRMTARVDADRNAMTRNPGDLQGEAEGTHAPGARDIEIVIDEVL